MQLFSSSDWLWEEYATPFTSPVFIGSLCVPDILLAAVTTKITSYKCEGTWFQKVYSLVYICKEIYFNVVRIACQSPAHHLGISEGVTKLIIKTSFQEGERNIGFEKNI